MRAGLVLGGIELVEDREKDVRALCGHGVVEPVAEDLDRTGMRVSVFVAAIHARPHAGPAREVLVADAANGSTVRWSDLSFMPFVALD